MTALLPSDREKALAAIAAGWGRTATPAHPMCICADPSPPRPTGIPPCTVCGAEQDERAAQQTAGCPMHRSTP